MNKTGLFVSLLIFSAILSASALAEEVIYLTECPGSLNGVDTTYVLQEGLECDLELSGEGNGNTIDLNGNPAAIHGFCHDLTIKNGYSGMVGLSGLGCKIINLHVTAETGFYLPVFVDGLIKDVTIDATREGIVIDEGSGNVWLKNVTITGQGDSQSIGLMVISNQFPDLLHGPFIIEDTKIENFGTDVVFDGELLHEVHLINDNFSDADAVIWGGQPIFFKEQRVTIRCVDQNNNAIPCVIEIKDNGLLPELSEEEAICKQVKNPTPHLYAGSDENGVVNVRLVSSIVTYEASPPVTYDFNEYMLVARSGSGTSDVESVEIDLAAPMEITMVINVEQQTLPACTIDQMLDLNNDGTVNVRDLAIMLRHIAGFSLNEMGQKNCNALNLLPR